MRGYSGRRDSSVSEMRCCEIEFALWGSGERATANDDRIRSVFKPKGVAAGSADAALLSAAIASSTIDALSHG